MHEPDGWVREAVWNPLNGHEAGNRLGGMPATGGVPGTGGAPATGGTPGTDGSSTCEAGRFDEGKMALIMTGCLGSLLPLNFSGTPLMNTSLWNTTDGRARGRGHRQRVQVLLAWSVA